MLKTDIVEKLTVCNYLGRFPKEISLKWVAVYMLIIALSWELVSKDWLVSDNILIAFLIKSWDVKEYKKYASIGVGKLSPMSVFVNKVLLQHSYLFTGC